MIGVVEGFAVNVVFFGNLRTTMWESEFEIGVFGVATDGSFTDVHVFAFEDFLGLGDGVSVGAELVAVGWRVTTE